MKRIRLMTLLCALVVSVAAGGCSSIEEYPRYDKVLTYQQPYDFTYLRVLEALNSFPEWILQETDKEKGIVVIRNTEFGHLFDRDKASAKVIIARIGRNETSVSLAPDSQKVMKGGDILERIDKYMHLE